MYLEPGKCAQCGKMLDASAKHAPHNFNLDALANQISFRPYFCSPACVERLSEADIEAHSQQTKQTSKDAERAHADRLTEIKTRLQRDIAHARYEANAKIARYKTLGPTPDQTRMERADDAFKVLGKLQAHEEDVKALETRVLENVDFDIRQLEKAADAAREKAQEEFHRQQNETSATRTDALPTLKLSSMGKFFHSYDASKRREIEHRPIPPQITDQYRYEHTHILGPSGSGKTTLIQELILRDLARADRPAIVVIDPKGFLVERIARLKQIDPNDLVIIDPRSQPPPPLNPFNIRGGPKVANQAIANFDYIFAQAGQSLTALARPAFRFCARLMFSLPNPSIWTLMELLESNPNDPRFQPYIDKLEDEGAKRFFQKDFYASRYRSTADLIKARFQDILSMPEVMAMFSSQAQPIDFAECLQQRKIILVNSAMELGDDVSRLVGRNVIALTLAAAFARGRGGPPAFLYIDEFQDYVDEDATPRQLRLAREYNLGIVMAHQQMFCNEFGDNTRTSVSSATVKYCSKVFSIDRSFMLKDLGCGEEFLDQQVPDHTKQLVKFACVVKGHPASSVEIKYPNITPDMLRDTLPEMRWSETHEPPQSEGSRTQENRPAEADRPIIAPQNISPPQTDDDATW